MEMLMILAVVVPGISGFMALALPKAVREWVALGASALNLAVSLFMFGQGAKFSVPWAGFGMSFDLRLYHFSSFILAAAAAFAFLVTLFSFRFMGGRDKNNQYYGYLLISIGMVNGAVLADNLVLMLFFWEGLLVTMFGMIAIGGRDAFRSAVKAFILVGVSDVLMMIGIAMTGGLAATLTISQIRLSLDSTPACVAFLLLVTGAVSKAGSMPFHSWIPDAATDAPLPFMAFMPAALEKLLGIYFLARITLDLYALTPDSWLSPVLMGLGVVTILLAVMMALIQKDYKRLLSYHAISQVGYMILGIGTAVPVGIVGGIFHMINHAMYKSCLFFTGGSVERQAGSTDLARLGGLGRRMPVTFACFVIAAAAISGVPPSNGFFSKELIYEGALQRHWFFYLAALAGSFLTAASFLKLGHAAFLGRANGNDGPPPVKEAPVTMLLPMIAIASGCILFGVVNPLPIDHLIVPVIGAEAAAGHHFSGLPRSPFLVTMTALVLLAAWLNHLYGVRRGGKGGLGAADHIHYSPLLRPVFDRAEKKFFDPFEIGMQLVGGIARLSWRMDRAVNWLYDVMAVRTARFFFTSIRAIHDGRYSTCMAWAVIGVFLMFLYMTY